MNRPTIFIGIDPAFRKDGFAMCVIDTTDNTVSFKVFKNGLLDFLSWLFYDAPDPIQCVFCVENSNLQDDTFDMRGSKPVVAKKSRSVGKNQAVSQCVVDVLQVRNFNVVNISPKAKGKKWTEIECLAVSKQEKHELGKAIKKEDCRDSYKLAIMAKDKSKTKFNK